MSDTEAFKSRAPSSIDFSQSIIELQNQISLTVVGAALSKQAGDLKAKWNAERENQSFEVASLKAKVFALEQGLKKEAERFVSETSKLREELALFRAKVQPSGLQLNESLTQEREGEAVVWNRAVDKSEKNSYGTQQMVREEHLRYVEQVRVDSHEKGPRVGRDGLDGNRSSEPPLSNRPTLLKRPPPMNQPPPMSRTPPIDRYQNLPLSLHSHVVPRNVPAAVDLPQQKPADLSKGRQVPQMTQPVNIQQTKPRQNTNVSSFPNEGQKMVIPSNP